MGCVDVLPGSVGDVAAALRTRATAAAPVVEVKGPDRSGTSRRYQRPAEVLLLRQEPGQVKKLVAGPGSRSATSASNLQGIHRGGRAEHPSRRLRRLPKDSEVFDPLKQYIIGQGQPRRPQQFTVYNQLQRVKAGEVTGQPAGARTTWSSPSPTSCSSADRLRQDLPRADAGQDPRRPVRNRGRHRADRGRLRRRGRREHPAQAHSGRRPRRQGGGTGSSTSTRSTRSPARARTRRSPATSPARACSRRCSRSSRARPPACRRRVAASTRTRSSSRSTRRTCCSSWAARSPAWRSSSSRATARGSGPQLGAAQRQGPGRADVNVMPRT